MKFLAAALTFVSALAGFPALAQDPELVNEIVAKVNNNIITRSDYFLALHDFKEELGRQMAGKSDAEVNAEYEKLKPTVLDILIEDLLLEQRAREISIDVEADLNQQWAAIAKENGFPKVSDFEEALKEQGVD